MISAKILQHTSIGVGLRVERRVTGFQATNTTCDYVIGDTAEHVVHKIELLKPGYPEFQHDFNGDTYEVSVRRSGLAAGLKAITTASNLVELEPLKEGLAILATVKTCNAGTENDTYYEAQTETWLESYLQDFDDVR